MISACSNFSKGASRLGITNLVLHGCYYSQVSITLYWPLTFPPGPHLSGLPPSICEERLPKILPGGGASSHRPAQPATLRGPWSQTNSWGGTAAPLPLQVATTFLMMRWMCWVNSMTVYFKRACWVSMQPTLHCWMELTVIMACCPFSLSPFYLAVYVYFFKSYYEYSPVWVG